MKNTEYICVLSNGGEYSFMTGFEPLRTMDSPFIEVDIDMNDNWEVY